MRTQARIPLTPRDPAKLLWGENHFNGISDMEMAAFGRAFHFSITNHTSVRRKSGESYYNHDCRMARIAMVNDLPMIIVICLLVHEAIEDDGWAKEQIEKDFGLEAGTMVDAVSKRPKSQFRSRQARLQDHLNRLHDAIEKDWRVAVLKLIDRWDNTTDTAALNTQDRFRLFDETEKHFLPLFRWAFQFIPTEYQKFYYTGIVEIENACDNYWRSLALQT